MRPRAAVLLTYMLVVLPGGSLSIGSALEGVAGWIDKMATICLVIVILIIVLGILWVLTQFSRGGVRG